MQDYETAAQRFRHDIDVCDSFYSDCEKALTDANNVIGTLAVTDPESLNKLFAETSDSQLQTWGDSHRVFYKPPCVGDILSECTKPVSWGNVLLGRSEKTMSLDDHKQELKDVASAAHPDQLMRVHKVLPAEGQALLRGYIKNHAKPEVSEVFFTALSLRKDAALAGADAATLREKWFGAQAQTTATLIDVFNRGGRDGVTNLLKTLTNGEHKFVVGKLVDREAVSNSMDKFSAEGLIAALDKTSAPQRREAAPDIRSKPEPVDLPVAKTVLARSTSNMPVLDAVVPLDPSNTGVTKLGDSQFQDIVKSAANDLVVALALHGAKEMVIQGRTDALSHLIESKGSWPVEIAFLTLPPESQRALATTIQLDQFHAFDGLTTALLATRSAAVEP